MARFVVYRMSDGLVVRSGVCPEVDLVGQAQEGEVSDGAAPEEVIADGTWYWLDGAYASAAPPVDMARADKERALFSIANLRLTIWQGGNAPTGGLQVDDASMGRMASWSTQALMSKITGTTFNLSYWIMADNSNRPVSGAEDFLAFVEAASTYKTAAVQNNASLKAAIRDASTAAELAAIDLAVGWPA